MERTQNIRIDAEVEPMRFVYKPLTAAEVIAMLQQWPDDTPVYVDMDHEGGNESQVRHVVPINEYGCRGVKLE